MQRANLSAGLHVCRFVRRSYNPISGDVSIAGVDDMHGVQTDAGDLLFLKGNAFPGLFGG